jgi:hypothetical protein
MIAAAKGALSGRLHRLSEELRGLDMDLKAGATPDVMSLQEFRQVLDNTRMTAWTVNELMNAAESQRDPEKVLSFLAAERLRRSTQMLKDLCADLDGQDVNWQTSGIQRFYETVNVLQGQLKKVINQQGRRAKEASQSS